jgi:hypothetical protein
MPLSVRADADSAWKYAAMNKGRHGSGKFALERDSGTIEFRAEVPCVEEANLASAVHELVAEFKSAISGLHYAEQADESPGPVPGGPRHVSTDDLTRLCSEGGWPCAKRERGQLVVDFHSPRGFYQAVIENSPRPGVRLSVEVARLENLSQAGRRGLAVFLLIASSLTRLARASVDERDGVVTASFETHFNHVPGAEEINEALASLSVASLLFAEEAKLFEHEQTARQYLEMQGLSESESVMSMKGELVQ